MDSLGELLSKEPIQDILCFHNVSTDFLTGENPPYHRHDGYEIYLFIRGNIRIGVEQDCYRLSRGDFVIIEPGNLHRSIVGDETPYERIGVNLSEAALRALSTERTNHLDCFRAHAHRPGEGILHLTASEVEEYTRLTDRYIAARASAEHGGDLRELCCLTELLLYTDQLFLEPRIRLCENVMPKLVADAMKYVEEHLSEELGLGKLSDVLNYSGNYISSQFKCYTGLTLREYILDQRIECAKRLLLEGSSVSDASLSSGFSDYANFIRSFKKKTGLSPGRYKKSNNIFA